LAKTTKLTLDRLKVIKVLEKRADAERVEYEAAVEKAAVKAQDDVESRLAKFHDFMEELDTAIEGGDVDKIVATLDEFEEDRLYIGSPRDGSKDIRRLIEKLKMSSDETIVADYEGLGRYL
jgi:hypothetical protein